MNKDLVEIYNAITDLKLQLPDVSIQAGLDFPEIVVVGGQVLLLRLPCLIIKWN